jgi:SAM-dependent methyltransferase
MTGTAGTGPPADPGQTWHYGVVAQWWAEFNTGGPEVPYFQAQIERYGQPALDVACGTGRLLLPYLRAGLDVDGCDISPDMLAYCRAAAGREGYAPALYAQATHELDLPRAYRTAYMCGGFGLGGDREHDLEGLRRLHRHLLPGGVLVLDHYVPYENAHRWSYWPRERRRELPERKPPPESGRRAADGSELALQARLVDLDPLAQVATYGMRARRWRDGRLEADEEYTLKESLYFRNELVMTLERAGFRDIRVEAGYLAAEPTPDAGVLVYVAHKPA